jgi:hypothetical protein
MKMQYETIILELLTRIKKLEEDVAKLKAQRASLPISGGETDNQQASETTAYRKMTDEMIEICYKCGKKAAEGENVQELADDISETTGMNRSSAIMYLYAVQGMLAGTIYKRAISAKAMKKYYDAIFKEYGSAGLRKAIRATRLHIDYRRECGHTVDSIEEICDRYESRL